MIKIIQYNYVLKSLSLDKDKQSKLHGAPVASCMEVEPRLSEYSNCLGGDSAPCASASSIFCCKIAFVNNFNGF